LKIEVKEATVLSNVPQGNVTAMSISVDGMEHIMSLLTNLYKDPELAVIREYYTNALDAHVAAGVTDKHVLVTLPSWDSPTYVVQDFGIGMSEEDIKNIYAQYGASTKRNTNDQVGAFGLGCKSALTIATQFTIVSVKDGWKTTALISKTETGVNTINIISRIDTSEGNGTTVKIPVPDDYSFNRKAEKFFPFSAPGLVKVNGNEPKYVLEGLTKVTDPNDPTREVFLQPDTYGTSYLIMGNVGYALSDDEIKSSLARLKREHSRLFLNMPKYFPVPIGSVDLTPSREGLRFTEKTEDLVDELITFMLDDLARIAQEEIDNSTNLTEFWKAQEKWGNLLEKDKMNVWKGEHVPAWIDLDNEMRIIERSDYYGSSHQTTKRFNLKRDSERILVTGFSADQYKRVNSYLTPYMKAVDLDSAVFVITDDTELFTNKWIPFLEKVTVVSGDDIIAKGKEQRKKDRASASSSAGPVTREKTKYPVVFLDDEKIRWVPSDEIPDDTPYLMRTHVWQNSHLDNFVKNLYYFDLNTDKDLSADRVKAFEALTKSRTIILMGGGRSETTLLSRVPTTYPLADDAKAAAVDVKALITPEVLAHYSVTKSSWQQFLDRAGLRNKIDRIKDKKIKAVIIPEEATRKAYDKAKATIDTLSWAMIKGVEIPSMELNDTKDSTLELTKKYPLVDAITTWQLNDKSRNHLITYLNAVHDETEAALASKVLPPIPAVPASV